MKKFHKTALYVLLLSILVVLVILLYSNLTGSESERYSESESSVSLIEDDKSITTDLSNLTTQNYLLWQIKNGDFSNLIVPESDDTLLEALRLVNNNIESRNYEWVEFDLNGNGTNELILQASNNEMSRMALIFTFDFDNQEVNLVYFHTADILRFLFLSENGNLIWYSFSYGIYNWNSYTHMIFDEEWNLIQLYTLQITYIYDMSEMPDNWINTNPDMSETGIYFHKEIGTFGEETFERMALNESQFIREFEEMAGFSFYNARPDWMRLN